MNIDKDLSNLKYMREIIESKSRIPKKMNGNVLRTQTKSLVMIHGKLKVQPIDDLLSANFCKEVHTGLDNIGLKQVYRTQTYSWPHIMRRSSSIIINGPQSGKTVSYLPAVCSLIKMRIDENRIPDKVGPIGIIITRSSVEVEKIATLSRNFLPRLRIIEASGKTNELKAEMLLINGCEILVCTLPSLVRLMNKNLKIFDSKKLQHLVFDDIDMVYMKELKIILNKCCASDNTANTKIQIIITSCRWYSWMMEFNRIRNDFQLCIGSYIEAAIYGKTTFTLKILLQSEKTKQVVKFARQNCYSSERLIIVCVKDNEVTEIANCLRNESISFIALQTNTEEQAQISAWENSTVGDMSILICCDELLPQLNISNAQNIIHYSLPSTWSRFSYRFSVFFDYHNDLLVNQIPVKDNAKCLIILDDTNSSQLPKLIDFLKIHHCHDITEEILKFCEKIKLQNNSKVKTYFNDICTNILQLGRCRNKIECKYRHFVTENDFSRKDIPRKGNIKVEIVNVLSPNHYICKILEIKSPDNNSTWEKVDTKDSLKFYLDLTNYYANNRNHQNHLPININDLCVTKHKNAYRRCRVVELPKHRIMSDYNIRVKLIDDGYIITVKSCNLLILPEKFKSIPSQIIDVRLAGVVPCDSEEDWDSQSKITVNKWFEKYIKNRKQFEAIIKFTFLDTIWVENIIILDKFKSFQGEVYEHNLKQELIANELAEINDETIKFLEQMANECEILSSNKYKTMVKMMDNFRASESEKTGTKSVLIETERKQGLVSRSSEENIATSLTKQDKRKEPIRKLENLSKALYKSKTKEKITERDHMEREYNDENSSYNNNDCNRNSMMTYDEDAPINSSNIRNVDINFNPDDINKILKEMQIPAEVIPSKNKSIDVQSKPTKDYSSPDESSGMGLSAILKRNRKICKNPINQIEKQKSINSAIPHLKTIYKNINIIWTQSESIIRLCLYIPDVNNYKLEITNEKILIIYSQNNEINSTLINFYGFVNPKYSSHEVRGLKIIIRLIKDYKGLYWPRLCIEDNKNPWISYDVNTINIEDDDDIIHVDDGIPHRYVSSSPRETDSEDEQSVILDNNNDDPLADEFD